MGLLLFGPDIGKDIGVTEWQPIDMAPKDGTLVDVWAKGLFSSARFTSVKYRSRMADWQLPNGDYLRMRKFVATHWMPLPPAPVDTHPKGQDRNGLGS